MNSYFNHNIIKYILALKIVSRCSKREQEMPYC
jgi:hypothetical protein